MKPTLLSLALLLAYSVAHAVTLTMPAPSSMDVLNCASGPVSPQYVVTGITPEGYTVGLVFEQSKCVQHSGRGGGTTAYHSGCAEVKWDGNGTLVSVDVLWTNTGRIAIPASTCLSPS